MIFNKNKFVIGALHLMPLKGYKDYEGYEQILEKALKELRILEEGGVDAVIVENNYNLPHRIKETIESVSMMEKLAKEIVKISKIPIGISILWNDFESAFKIAKSSGAKFIRVPVFVDSVKTDFGKIYADPKKVISARKSACAEEVLIFADLQVKHAEMIDPNKSLMESAIEAKEKGADAVIISGKWTGDAPLTDDLQETRKAVGIGFPIIVGSGADKNNIKKLFEIADGVIVSTSLKEGDPKNLKEERNIKPYEAKIDLQKVKDFMEEAKNENSYL